MFRIQIVRITANTQTRHMPYVQRCLKPQNAIGRKIIVAIVYVAYYLKNEQQENNK